MNLNAKVIRSYTVADAMVVSNSAVETYAEYNPATSYALNSYCTLASTHRLYQCIQAPNVGHTPNTSPLYWTDSGPSNKWAMFDTQVSTATTATGTLTVTIATGLIDSVALVGVSAQSARVVATDGLGGATIYDVTLPFTGDVPTDWYTYFFFDDTSSRTLGTFKDIPPYQTIHITVTLTDASGGAVALGALLFGLSSDIGQAQFGAAAGIIDYSRKTTSSTGVTTFEQRAYSKRLSISLVLANTDLNRVLRVLYGVRATPCVWIMSSVETHEEALILFGFYRDFSVTIAYPNESLCSLELESLI